ncbi:MAG: hypothetical protein R2705_10355 [Ilumatobacteraceae bacterium]
MDDHGIADASISSPSIRTGREWASPPSFNTFALDRARRRRWPTWWWPRQTTRACPARRSYEKAGFVPMPIQWNIQILRL